MTLFTGLVLARGSGVMNDAVLTVEAVIELDQPAV